MQVTVRSQTVPSRNPISLNPTRRLSLHRLFRIPPQEDEKQDPLSLFVANKCKELSAVTESIHDTYAKRLERLKAICIDNQTELRKTMAIHFFAYALRHGDIRGRIKIPYLKSYDLDVRSVCEMKEASLPSYVESWFYLADADKDGFAEWRFPQLGDKHAWFEGMFKWLVDELAKNFTVTSGKVWWKGKDDY